MLGVSVNALAIILGSVLGLLLKKGIKESLLHVIMQGIGLSVVIIGIAGAIKTDNTLLLVFSLVIGGIIGSLIGIEYYLNRFGAMVEKRFSSENGGFARGFVTASLVYCVGAMAIIGSLESGISNDHSTLYIKALLDGVTAVVFTATLGYGVIFSAISVFLYQGGIVLLSNEISDVLTPTITNEITAVGSVLILGIGINILELKKIRIGDLLPAVFIPPLWFFILFLIG